MHSKTLKRYLAYSLLVASLILPTTSVKPQQRKVSPNELPPIIKPDCPSPIVPFTLTAPQLMSFDATDFSQAQLNAPHMTGLGDPSSDEYFLHTFVWKREKRCCQITKARLTVNMKANSTCQSHTGHDAGNDSIVIMYNTLTVPNYVDYIYSGSGSCNAGQTATYTRDLNATALANINQSGRLSFAVQDDTQVVSATLQLWGCCLGANTPETAGYATQKECEAHEKAPCSLQYGGWHRTN